MDTRTQLTVQWLPDDEDGLGRTGDDGRVWLVAIIIDTVDAML